MSKWTTAAGVALAPGIVGYRVVTNGNDGAYQVSSPPIAVPPQHRMLVRVQGTTVKGRPCMGVLDQAGNWLVPPVGDRAEFSLDTRDNKSIMFVFIECGRTIGFEAASAFEVESVSYAVLANADGGPPRP